MIRAVPALVAALVMLAGCGREADPPLPTAASVAQPPGATQAAPTPTRVLPPPTLPPSPTPEPTPCAFAGLPELAPAGDKGVLGCPLEAGASPISTAYAPFEGGQMLWRSDTDTIYVLTNDNRWTSYPNAWREGDPAFSCGEEANPPTPVRGFGRVWCENRDVQAALGAVTAAEIGDGAGTVQAFERATVLTAPWGSLFVLGADGTWRRVDIVEG